MYLPMESGRVFISRAQSLRFSHNTRMWVPFWRWCLSFFAASILKLPEAEQVARVWD